MNETARRRAQHMKLIEAENRRMNEAAGRGDHVEAQRLKESVKALRRSLKSIR